MIECKYELSVDKSLKERLSKDYNKRALERNSEEVFSSDRGGSTALLLRALFKNYNKSAKIVGTSLCNKILEDEECRKRLDMFELPVKILLTNSPNEISNKIKNYFTTKYSKTQIKEIKGYVIQNIDKKLETDFLILDNIAYFVELTNFKLARCSFNNIEGALNLSNQFDNIYNND